MSRGDTQRRAVQVFVSHTNADAALAHRLAADLAFSRKLAARPSKAAGRRKRIRPAQE